MNTKERIMQLIAELGMTKSEFERVCGLSNGYINSMRNSVGAKGVSLILSKFPQVNKSWLVLGEGDMFIGENSASQFTEQNNDDDGSIHGHHVTVGGNASNINNGTTEKTILIALTEVSEMRKLLAEVININKEQSQRLISIVDKIADRI